MFRRFPVQQDKTLNHRVHRATQRNATGCIGYLSSLCLFPSETPGPLWLILWTVSDQIRPLNHRVRRGTRRHATEIGSGQAPAHEKNGDGFAALAYRLLTSVIARGGC